MASTDAGSLPNLTNQFHFYSDPTSAVAGCVKAGISVFLDPYSAPLRDAFEEKLVTEADIERNIRGNLRMRMRLGEFDPPEMSPWDKISGTEEPWYGEKNKALARKVTQESIVLLKNSDGLLPLDKSKLRSIAVIGPFGDSVLVDWYSGMPPYAVTPLEGIRNKVGPNVRVRYAPDDNNRNASNLAAESVLDPAQANPEKLAQLEAVKRWFNDDWKRIEPKLRTSIVEGVSVFLSLFDDNSKVKRVFCPKKECYDPQKNADNRFGKPLPSFSWLIEQGSVCALNFPIGMNAGLAKALGVMMKLDFERAVLNRVPKMEAHPEQYFRQVLFLCDEYQHFATVGESDPTGDEKFFREGEFGSPG